MQVVHSLVDPQDAKIIESIPLSLTQLADRDGWNFTNDGKYKVKSGYDVERVYSDRERTPLYMDLRLLLLMRFAEKCITLQK